ncbi:hypothetical protein Q7P35_008655 [Cladosporium inversicolor]
MSGAEAALVLGLISSAIAIIDASQKIYDAARDASGLHKAFKTVAENIPLVLDTLRAAEKAQQKAKSNWQTFDDAKKQQLEDTSKAVKPVFETCKANAKALRDVFEEVVPGDEAGRMERYLMALKTVSPRKKHKVESMMQEMLEKLQLLHTHHSFTSAIDVVKLEAGVKEMKNVEPSIPQDDAGKFIHSGTGSINVNSGDGEQYNNSITGGENNSQHNAKNQYFGHTGPA